MTAEQLCQRLLRPTDRIARERWLQQAADRPECLAYLLERAQEELTSDPEGSRQSAQLAIEIADRRGEARSGAIAGRLSAQASRALGRHAEALTAFSTAADCARRAGDTTLEAQVQIGSIDSLGCLGRTEEAFILARRLEATLRANGAEEDAAKVLVNAGNLYYRRDRYTEALDCFEQALAVLSRSGDALAIARVQANSANILTQLSRVDEGIALYERARTAFAEAGLASLVAMIDTNVGYLRYLSGELSAALALLSNARQEFALRHQELETAKCDADMADVYRELNLFPEALECYDRAIPRFERASLDYERARAELGRAAVLMRVGRPEEAFVALESADTSFHRQKNGFQRAHVRLIRAYMLRSVGRTAEAATEARAAARFLAHRRLSGWAAEARFVLADIALNAGQDASQQMLGVGRVARRQGRGWLVCRVERALGLHYGQKGDTKRAIRHFRAGVAALEEVRTLVASESLHVAFLRDKLAVYEDLIGVLLARGRRRDIEEALDCLERSKSRLLLERMQTALDSRPVRSAASQSNLARLAALRAELSRGYRQINAFEEGDPRRLLGSSTATVDTLAPLEQVYRAALNAVELTELASAPARFALAAPATADQLRSALRTDETLVEFFLVNGTVGAFVLTREGLHVQRAIARVEDVAYAARRLRFQLQRHQMEAGYVRSHFAQMHAGIKDTLRQLYALLLKPLEARLMTEKVVLVPQGLLHGLPFHAFYDGIEFALERYEFLYAPSAAIWYAGSVRSQAQRAGTSPCPGSASLLLMGLPEPGIERVSEEIEQVGGLFPGAQVFCGEQATLEAFRAHAGTSRLLHLATHALFRADNPLFSGLQFADGWLLARDLYEMALDCDLATLSACRTGVAFVEPGDELFGLTRGFLSAGVRSVAASLWPADDTATAALMVRFYRYLAQGTSHAAALRAAQRAMQTDYPHPYYWAAFALIGER